MELAFLSINILFETVFKFIYHLILKTNSAAYGESSKSLELFIEKFNLKSKSNKSLTERLTYEAPPLLPVLHLPYTKMNSKLTYPRVPTIYGKPQEGDNFYNNFIPPNRLVNQYGLSEQTKLKLYNSPKKHSIFENIKFDSDDSNLSQENKKYNNKLIKL
jgi:hypothetical protein